MDRMQLEKQYKGCQYPVTGEVHFYDIARNIMEKGGGGCQYPVTGEVHFYKVANGIKRAVDFGVNTL